MYLANCTRQDIAFTVNLLARRTHLKTLGWRENHPEVFERHSGPWVVVSEKGGRIWWVMWMLAICLIS
jgi:hypothetical protein